MAYRPNSSHQRRNKCQHPEGQGLVEGDISHVPHAARSTHRNHQVEENTDKVKLDEQHREYRWINTMEDYLHPYLAEMIENTGLFR